MNPISDRISGAPVRVPNHWENYWSGGEKGDARDAAVTGAARSKVFQSAWRSFFEDSSFLQKHGDRCLVDLACGSGVVTDIAVTVLTRQQLANFRVIGVDSSISAARQFSGKFQSSGANLASGIVADALALPFAPASIDVAVSQFGLEYAGVGAIAEIGRLIAPEGGIMCLTHYESGAIEGECRDNYRFADAILSNDIFGKGRKIFKESDAPKAMRDLDEALQALRDFSDGSPDCAGRHLQMRLVSDVTRLVVRRSSFDPREAIAWLDANEAEISMYRDRMQSMTGAALNRQHVNEIIERWKAEGLSVLDPSAITMEDASAPSAWRLCAQRLEAVDAR